MRTLPIENKQSLVTSFSKKRKSKCYGKVTKNAVFPAIPFYLFSGSFLDFKISFAQKFSVEWGKIFPSVLPHVEQGKCSCTNSVPFGVAHVFITRKNHDGNAVIAFFMFCFLVIIQIL